MPNINVRSFQVEPGAAPKPVEGGASAYEMEGRHIEAAYSQAGHEIGGAIAEVGGQYVKHEERLDAIDQANYFAKKQEAITQRLTAAKLTNDPSDPNYLDPHDPDAVTKMLDDLDKSDSDFAGNARTVNGQAAFSKQNAEFRSAAFRQATVEQADLAAKDITNKFTNTVNTYMATAYLDPMAAKDILPQLESLRKVLPAGADGEVDRAKTEVATQAAKSMIDNSPDPLKAFQQAQGLFGKDIGPKMGELQDHSIAMDRARRQDIELARTQFKQQQQDISQAKTQQYMNFFGQNGGKMPPNASAQILQDNDLLPNDKRELINFSDRLAKGENVRTDVSTYAGLLKGVSDGSASDIDIIKAANSSLLSTEDTKSLLKLSNADPALKAANKQFHDWATAQIGQFTQRGLLGIGDPQGKARWQQFEQDAYSQFRQAYDNKGDWQGMLKQGSKTYLGSVAQKYLPGKNANLPLSGLTTQGADGKTYTFIGQSQADWNNPKMWKQQGK